MLFFIVKVHGVWKHRCEFKYISCYSLSEMPFFKESKYIEFKYISCYSLSLIPLLRYCRPYYSNTSHVILYRATRADVNEGFAHSNTSHVILYPTVDMCCRCNFRHSNTSHVILYHVTLFAIWKSKFIQIHLMLFFIRVAPILLLMFLLFKYISCYSLSCWQSISRYRSRWIQIHLMLFFIFASASASPPPA